MDAFWGAFIGAIAGWFALGVISILVGGQKNE